MQANWNFIFIVFYNLSMVSFILVIIFLIWSSVKILGSKYIYLTLLACFYFQKKEKKKENISSQLNNTCSRKKINLVTKKKKKKPSRFDIQTIFEPSCQHLRHHFLFFRFRELDDFFTNLTFKLPLFFFRGKVLTFKLIP